MGLDPISGGLIMGGLGALGGALGKSNTSTSTSGINLNPASDLQNQAGQVSSQSLDQLSGLVNAGPGQQDVGNAYQSQLSFAQMLQQYSQTGGLPNQQDLSNAQGFASQIYQPQQTALNQSFISQGQQAAQLAASLGRSVDDPIIQAKLRTGYMQQQAGLTSQQGSYAAQLGLQLPQQRLNLFGQSSNVLQGLATQAMQNRSSLLSAGQGVLSNERNYQIGTSQHYGDQTTTSQGGLGGAITGGIAGFGAGAASNLFSGGGVNGLQSPSLQNAAAGSNQAIGNFGLNSQGSSFGGGQSFGGFSAPRTYSLGMQ